MKHPPPPAPTTPCIGVCTMEGPVCRGCFRTLAEIAAWSQLSEPERQRIMATVLPARIEAFRQRITIAADR